MGADGALISRPVCAIRRRNHYQAAALDGPRHRPGYRAAAICMPAGRGASSGGGRWICVLLTQILERTPSRRTGPEPVCFDGRQPGKPAGAFANDADNEANR